jgi:hypothetical protein
MGAGGAFLYTYTAHSADESTARRSQQTRLVTTYVRRHVICTESIGKFESEGSEGFSSSIVDLFDSLRSPITVLQDLDWSDEYQEARFFTSISKVVLCLDAWSLFLTTVLFRTDHQQGCRAVLQGYRRAFHDRDVSKTNGLPPAPKVVCLDRTGKTAGSRREEDRAVQLPARILRQVEQRRRCTEAAG